MPRRRVMYQIFTFAGWVELLVVTMSSQNREDKEKRKIQKFLKEIL
jgi:hypothetical protein